MFRRKLKKIEGDHSWHDVVIIIALIIFIRKNKNNPKYTESLG